YKAERFLHGCIDSILAQTFEDFELLLIDDGSPDSSGTGAERDGGPLRHHRDHDGDDTLSLHVRHGRGHPVHRAPERQIRQTHGPRAVHGHVHGDEHRMQRGTHRGDPDPIQDTAGRG
ncbi:MAG: glycosyltransferase family 2 protein, partial [Candidatus Methanomethylophilaceae archaeon]|nr:glycosyltransferase family 2 protein [Candidatus Methanomethylophilaceae archaeon]